MTNQVKEIFTPFVLIGQSNASKHPKRLPAAIYTIMAALSVIEVVV